MAAKDDLLGSGELVDSVEYLIPGVLRYETDEQVQTDDRLLIDMLEDGHCEGIDIMTLTSHRINVRG
jgi:Na+-translocating ferredoxin:NAD+ oxidoreductase RnfE subunit